MIKVMMNEQHTLMEDQERVLNERFGNEDIEYIDIPAEGWTLEEMDEQMDNIIENLGWKIREIAGKKVSTAPAEVKGIIIFVSPVPYMIKELQRTAITGDYNGGAYQRFEVLVFHNDRREKKEIPDGNGGAKIINTVAKEGWQLV